MEVKRITPDEAKQLLEAKSGYVYLDVRTVPEFDAGHVPGAKNVPVTEPDAWGRMQLNSRFVEIIEANFAKDARIITGCQVGGRSLRAAALLLEAGFTNVVDMRGGFGGEKDEMGRLSFPGWAPRGYPVSTESVPENRYESLAMKRK